VILVAGLGNPGSRYEDSRHNLGFRVVDRLSRRAGEPAWRERFQGEFALIELSGERVGLLKPLTYMNVSGHSVQPACAFYKIEPRGVVVVHDELDLLFGELKLKSGGGDAGHRGVRSVIEQLGTPDFVRLRMGIGRRPAEFRGDGKDFVLEAFAAAERAAIEPMVERAADAVTLFVERGLQAAMNATNQRSKN
jgi:peptidyl-tRNA hydrolase, PTH1 family